MEVMWSFYVFGVLISTGVLQVKWFFIRRISIIYIVRKEPF